MSKKTTLNIHLDILKKISLASEINQFSESEIIKILLKKVLINDYHKAALSRCIQYQESDNSKNWKKFHIKYSSEEYEYFLDLRRLLKMSVSCAVAYAVKKYINELLHCKKWDNYQFESYTLGIGMVNDVIYWKLYWGNPKEPCNLPLPEN